MGIRKIEYHLMYAIVLIFLSVAFLDAHAISVNEPTLNFNLDWVLQDFSESIAGIFSASIRDNLKMKHLAEVEMQVEIKRELGEDVPTELKQRIVKKTDELARDSGSSSLEHLMFTVQNSGELIKIRSYVNLFHEYRDICVKQSNDLLQKCNGGINGLEKDVNSLNLVKKHCEEHIDVRTLLLAENPFITLRNYCSQMNGVSESMAKSMLDGADVRR